MTPWVTILILINVVMLLVTMSVPAVTRALMLVPGLVLTRPWTPITYMFLHAGLGHLFFNMIILYFFGSRLEMRLGGRGFLGLYLVSGLMGAALSFVFTPFTAIVGASGAVYGVTLAFALYWPREPIYIWGILRVEARWLVTALAVMALLFVVTGTGGRIAHFAHLGGFLGGYLFVKWREMRSPARKFRERATGGLARKKRVDRKDLERWSHIPRDDMHPINRAELDRVMEKIEKNGAGSLTEDERAFLDRFSPD